MYKSIVGLCCLLLTSMTPAFAVQNLVALSTPAPPVIDGKIDDQWSRAQTVTVHDVVADIDITLRALHDADRVYLLAQYKDSTENRLHRALVWNPGRKIYAEGPTREDCLVLKWSMVAHETTLTLKEDRPYRADIWFWKAHRTDHAGYADDKMQFYTSTRDKKAKLIISDSGKVFYLLRQSDNGEPAYQPRLLTKYISDIVPKYDFTIPTESRADIRAKGLWQDGVWTIEFSRELNTGHSDDVQFDLNGTYPFGVSRYEIAGRDPEPETETPLYGCGDVGELIRLSFEK